MFTTIIRDPERDEGTPEPSFLQFIDGLVHEVGATTINGKALLRGKVSNTSDVIYLLDLACTPGFTTFFLMYIWHSDLVQ